jgi:hypothetical protein
VEREVEISIEEAALMMFRPELERRRRRRSVRSEVVADCDRETDMREK